MAPTNSPDQFRTSSRASGRLATDRFRERLERNFEVQTCTGRTFTKSDESNIFQAILCIERAFSFFRQKSVSLSENLANMQKSRAEPENLLTS